MEQDKLKIIQELMDELQDQLSNSSDDFNNRLGRSKPEAKIEISAINPESIDEDMEDMSPEEHMDMEDDSEDEEYADEDMDMGDESPQDKFKKRLMKLRE